MKSRNIKQLIALLIILLSLFTVPGCGKTHDNRDVVLHEFQAYAEAYRTMWNDYKSELCQMNGKYSDYSDVDYAMDPDSVEKTIIECNIESGTFTYKLISCSIIYCSNYPPLMYQEIKLTATYLITVEFSDGVYKAVITEKSALSEPYDKFA